MIPVPPTPSPAPKASPMRRLVRLLPAFLPALVLTVPGAARAMRADESPAGWWAPTLRDCADPASPRAFEIRLKPQAEARLAAHDLDCRIDRVSDTAIGYRLHMRCFRSAEDRRAGTNAEPRQIVVDAIGPVTMRADGRRVYRCGSRPAAALPADRAVADAAPAPPAGAAQPLPVAQAPQVVAQAPPQVAQTPPASPAAQPHPVTVPALPLPDAPIRLVSLTPDASPAPAPAVSALAVSGPPAQVPPTAVRTAALPVEPPAPAPRLVPPAAPAPVAPVALPAVRRGRVIGFPGAQAPGTIVVDTAARFLYLVRGDGMAIRYRVAVGRPGTTWKGVETVTAKQEWPQWTPTPEMRRSRPGLPRHVAGGAHNPLGARALYLGSTLYRIHGTTNPRSIGRAASAGCFRMLNEDVIELYRFVPVGTKVQVI